MTILRTMFVLIAVTAATAHAQSGYIALYSDSDFTKCWHCELPNSLMPVYVVHREMPGGSTAAQFAVQTNNPVGFAYLGQSTPLGAIGSFWLHDDGLGGAISYGACLASPNHIATINLFTLGINPPCVFIEVVPDPGASSGNIDVVDCANNLLIGQGHNMVVNPDGTCIPSCVIGPPADCNAPIPVRESTWGRVKALYD